MDVESRGIPQISAQSRPVLTRPPRLPTISTPAVNGERESQIGFIDSENTPGATRAFPVGAFDAATSPQLSLVHMSKRAG